jgi:hypothetical protein
MKELKIKNLWAVDIDNVQWETFKYKKEAINYIICCRMKGIKGNPTMNKRKVITDKY